MYIEKIHDIKIYVVVEIGRYNDISISMATNQNRRFAFYKMFRTPIKKTSSFFYIYSYDFHIVI